MHVTNGRKEQPPSGVTGPGGGPWALVVDVPRLACPPCLIAAGDAGAAHWGAYVAHRFPLASVDRSPGGSYLNEGWTPAHGGELRLVPFGGAPVDVPPAPLGRAVLFASDRMLHGTLPARVAPRCIARNESSDAN